MEIFQHSRKGAARVINEACILTKNAAKSKREGDVSGMPSSEIRRQGERFFSLAKCGSDAKRSSSSSAYYGANDIDSLTMLFPNTAAP